MTEWKPIETVPRDGTNCLFFQPGNPNAVHSGARRTHIRVDAFSEVWPNGIYRYAEAKYTHWMPLPDPPSELPAGPVRNDPDTGIAAAIVKGIGK